jgi:hypothetical protein
MLTADSTVFRRAVARNSSPPSVSLTARRHTRFSIDVDLVVTPVLARGRSSARTAEASRLTPACARRCTLAP